MVRLHPRYLPLAPRVFLVAMAILLFIAPLPFAVISPGPTSNLLAGVIKFHNSDSVDSKGSSMAASSIRGKLLSLTVYVTTPHNSLNGPALIAAWARGDQLVLPREVIYPKQEKDSQAIAQGASEMSGSFDNARSAAGRFLGKKFSSKDMTLSLKETGGPSAGLAFALAIIAKLGHADLLAGRTIGATGTISATGQVGAIGGIDQKLMGAKAAGATAVLIPTDNCQDLTSIPHHLRVIPVSTLAQAVAILAQPQGAWVTAPHC